MDQIRTTLFGLGSDSSEPGNDDPRSAVELVCVGGARVVPDHSGTDVMTVNTPAFSTTPSSTSATARHSRSTPTAPPAASATPPGSATRRARRCRDLTRPTCRARTLANGGTLDVHHRGHSQHDLGDGAAGAPPSFGEGARRWSPTRPCRRRRLLREARPSGSRWRCSMARDDRAGLPITSKSPQTGITVVRRDRARSLDLDRRAASST